MTEAQTTKLQEAKWLIHKANQLVKTAQEEGWPDELTRQLILANEKLTQAYEHLKRIS